MQLFVTGVSGYLGGLVLKALEGNPVVGKIVGIDVAEPHVSTPKLEFHRLDVRDPAVRDVMKGSDAALHMAFILNEIRDKQKTHDININGSKNVYHACLDTGVPWIIQLSSMAAFGPHPDNPVPLRETDYPRGAPDCYYCYGKAELEHYLGWLALRHPELETTVVRPTVIIGDSLDNTVAWLFRGRFAALAKGHDSLAQFVHEDDLARAIVIILERRAKGVFHVTSDDYISISEMMKRAGMIAPSIPENVLERVADLSFAMGTSPVSSHWVRMFAHSMVGSSERLKELGWKPAYTSVELFEKYVVARKKCLTPARAYSDSSTFLK